MEKRAKVYTYSVIHSASEIFMDQVPYVVAVLKDGKNRFNSIIAGYEEGMNIDVGCVVEFLKVDERGNTIYKFID